MFSPDPYLAADWIRYLKFRRAMDHNVDVAILLGISESSVGNVLARAGWASTRSTIPDKICDAMNLSGEQYLAGPPGRPDRS